MKQKIRRITDTVLVPLGAVIFICSMISVIASPLGFFSITHGLQIVWILLAFCISAGLALSSFKLTRNTIRKINSENTLSRAKKAEEIDELGVIARMEQDNKIAQEKIFKIQMRNELAWTLVFWPIFIGIWITSAFVWGPLTGLAIGWLPATIGGGLIYSIFHSDEN